MKILCFKWLRRLFIPTKPEQNEPTIPIIIEQETNELYVEDGMPDFLKETLGRGSTEEWNYSVASINEPAGKEELEITDAVQIKNEDERETVSEANKNSLLDNKPLVKMFTECADLLQDLDDLMHYSKSAHEQFILQMVREKICTALLLSGGTSISNDKSFDIIRHVSINRNYAINGMPTQEFVETGIMLEDRVVVRAKVKLEI